MWTARRKVGCIREKIDRNDHKFDFYACILSKRGETCIDTVQRFLMIEIHDLYCGFFFEKLGKQALDVLKVLCILGPKAASSIIEIAAPCMLGIKILKFKTRQVRQRWREREREREAMLQSHL